MLQASRPRVSVVIPAYDCADYIRETLDSVFAQTYCDFEVIVVNDGSPDTAKLEVALQPYRNRIVYLQQENWGPSAARNLGIRHARAEYVAFLDSDDHWLPGYLAAQMKILEETPSLDMVYSDSELCGDSGRRFMEIYPSRGPVTFEGLLTRACAVNTPSCVVVRTRMLGEAGLFDECFRGAEDLDLWLRIVHRGGKVAYHQSPLVRRQLRSGSLSAEALKIRRDETMVLKKLESCLQLSLAERMSLRKRMAENEAYLALEEGKGQLSAGQVEQAAISLRKANTFFKTAKLNAVLLGLRIAPRLTRVGARTWQRLLVASQHLGASRRVT